MHLEGRFLHSRLVFEFDWLEAVIIEIADFEHWGDACLALVVVVETGYTNLKSFPTKGDFVTCIGPSWRKARHRGHPSRH